MPNTCQQSHCVFPSRVHPFGGVCGVVPRLYIMKSMVFFFKTSGILHHFAYPTSPPTPYPSPEIAREYRRFGFRVQEMQFFFKNFFWRYLRKAPLPFRISVAEVREDVNVLKTGLRCHSAQTSGCSILGGWFWESEIQKLDKKTGDRHLQCMMSVSCPYLTFSGFLSA